MPARSPYNGTAKKLVLAFDVGTTFSGISYRQVLTTEPEPFIHAIAGSILDPGQIPEIKGVTRFPAQEHVGGDSKIPTIIYYDQYGVVRAVGAEALKEDLESMVEEEGWTKAEWFKLHLRPSSDFSATERIPPLPSNKTVVDVFSDFLDYLFKCSQRYIEETHGNGAVLWSTLQNHIEFVLTHPNGWEGAQQAQMRKAAIRAGLVPDTAEGRLRVHFVTEGEASLHFCIQKGLTAEALKDGEGVLIVDAGGGTIDITAYGQNSASKALSFQEIASPQCYLQGSIFVTNRARTFLEDLLGESKFCDDIDHITLCFDKTTKLRFRDIKEPQFIKFGSARDKDLTLGIRAGQLRLKGYFDIALNGSLLTSNSNDVSTFFEPSISCITQCILEQRKISSRPIHTVFLVGGFAASDWLFTQLKYSLEPLGISFSRPDSHVNKAVADGGVYFYTDHWVTTRIAKYSYGISCCIPYDSTDTEHQSRYSFINPAGKRVVPCSFSMILPKNTEISETTEFRQPYQRVYSMSDKVPPQIQSHIRSYRGESATPRWIDKDRDMYSKLCTVVADTPPSKTVHGSNHVSFRRIEFKIVIRFGLTELTAEMQWEEMGEIKRSPAEVVYDIDSI